MRDDPYPARFYGRLLDEPFTGATTLSLPHDGAETFPFQHPLSRVLLLLMTLYLCFALLLIFVVSSYAAPSESATMSPPHSAECVETAAVAAH